MKRVALCFDGTWDRPADTTLPQARQVESNVSRFARSVDPVGADGVEQVTWYNEGVGTQWFDHLAGGAFGVGLDEHILSGYRFLANHYDEGDAVYVLGFSRGAYAARSLVGLVRNCGLVRPSFADWQVAAAYGIYRVRDDGPDTSTARAFRAAFSREISVKFLGVWDTVGALGIPLHFADRLNMKVFQFHDLQLSKVVENAAQAVALDEHREDFNITLWDPTGPPAQPLEQRWFVGAHGDVGGGDADRSLSDITLRWMQDHAAAAGLSLSPVGPGGENWLGPVDNSYNEFLGGVYAEARPPFYRRVFSTRLGGEVVDPTVDLRRGADPDYRPPNPGLPPFPPARGTAAT